MLQKLLQYIFVLLSVFLLNLHVYSQYQMQHYTTENGLPSNGIKGLQWDDSTGFLWIATEAGVVRYNGMGFTTFDINTNPDLGSSRIVFLLKNNAGKIYTAAEKGNLLVVDKNKLAPFFRGDNSELFNFKKYWGIGLSDTLFRQCYKNIWASTNFSLIFPVVSYGDTAGVIFARGQLLYYSVTTLQPEPMPATFAKSDVRYLFKTGGETFYCNQSNEFYLLDILQRKGKQTGLLDVDGKPFLINRLNSKIFWQNGSTHPVLLQDGKAWIIEKKNNEQLQCRLVATNIPVNTKYSFAVYNDKYLFLGSSSKGLYLFHQNQLISKQPIIITLDQPNSVYSQAETPDGNVITSNGIVYGDKAKSTDYFLGKNFAKSVYLLNDSILYYSVYDSLLIYNKKSRSTKLLAKTPFNENFSLASSGGQLYFVGQQGIGIIQENGVMNFVKKFDPQNITHYGPYSMVEIAPGKLAFANCSGLIGYDIKTKQIDTILSLPAVCFRSLYKEGDYIFIGTYGGGYYIMKNGILKSMPLDINDYLKYTHCFIKDRNGFCWISTNNGLFKVKFSDMTDAYDNDLQQVYYHYLGKDEGMETTEMNGGCMPCALRLKNDNFSFPTMDGLVWFNPEQLSVSLPSGSVYIDQLMVDGQQKSLQESGMISLGESVKKMDILLALSAWCKKENLYISYQLDNEKWMPVEMAANGPRISISNLSHGPHRLLIRKLNGFGIGNFSYSSIAFTVATPFYLQWWFRILFIILIIAAGYLFFRFLLHRSANREKKLTAMVEQKTADLNLKNMELEKSDRIKTRLISVINHDIITPLKFMHYAGNALLENKGVINEEKKLETIADIAQTAKDMEMLSSQILNWIIYNNPDQRMQKEQVKLHQLVEMIFRVLQFSAKQKNTILKNEIPQNCMLHQYLEPLRVMIYNLVLNSLSFTRNGNVSISCVHEKQRIVLRITDTGLGMTKEQVESLLGNDVIITAANIDNKKGTGLGYLIIKDLLKMMKGELDIKSSKNTGTSVFITLPQT